jgi:hypothetical protein
MRLIDADKLYPDCMTRDGKLAISQSQLANAPTINPCENCDLYFKAMTVKTMREAERT